MTTPPRENDNSLVARLVQIISEESHQHANALRSDVPLADLGITSMSVMTILVRLEHELGIELSGDNLEGTRLSTIADISILLQRLLDSGDDGCG